MENWTAGDTVNAVGLLLTFLTVARTALVARKIRQAVERTESRLTLNQVLILLPELKHLERHLQSACDQNDSAKARNNLNDWRLSASELSAFMVTLQPPLQGEPAVSLIKSLQESLGLAHQARELLFTGASSVTDATKRLRKVMAEVCEMGAKVGAQLKSSGQLPVAKKKRWKK